MKKINLVIMLFCAIFITSCTITKEEQPFSDSGQVVINVSNTTKQPDSIEEAVMVAYESVVVINASSMTSTSSGSGVIIGHSDEYTYIVTCCHVVEAQTEYEVITSNNLVFQAKLVGADPMTDLAVVAIQKVDIKEATIIKDSNDLKVGSTAIAIGNPLGTLGGSVTKGIVSATSRSIKMSDGSVHNLIQTDAAINSGNSGGGLFNSSGELIGIVSSKYSATGVEGLGFAIPTNTVLKIITELIEYGYVVGVTNLGVTFSDGYVRTSGGFFGSYKQVVYVSYVDKNGSAYNILKNEDILVKIKVTTKNDGTKELTLTDSTKASSVNQFLDELDLTIGDEIIFTIKRNGYSGAQTDVKVKLEQYVYGE